MLLTPPSVTPFRTPLERDILYGRPLFSGKKRPVVNVMWVMS